MAQDPNQRCVCGYRRFRERRVPVSAGVQRWMRFADNPVGGYGSAHLGTYFGTGPGLGDWGLFDATNRTTRLDVVCESCGRVRLSKNLGGVTAMGGYFSSGRFYIVAADVGSVGCFQIRLEGPGGTYTVPVKLSLQSPAPLAAPTPETTAESPPAGAETASTLLVAKLPQVSATGSYTVTLIDRCGGVETLLASMILEAPPMLIHAETADLNGAPTLWLDQRITLPDQPSSGASRGIPLDKCDYVLEYDARFLTAPDAQGWSHGGTGSDADYSLVSGGALQAATAGSGVTSYWEKALTGGAVTELHTYARYLVSAAASGHNTGGLYFRSLIGSSGSNFKGARFNFRDGELYYGAVDGSGDTGFSASTDPRYYGWHETAMSCDISAPRDLLVHDGNVILPGNLGGVGAAAADEVICRFGDVYGDGVTAYIRNFVASAPGRFIRAWFKAYTQVTDPVLRLYLAAETYSSGGAKARIKVRYGTGSGSQTSIPVGEVSGTVNFTSTNTMFVLPLSFTGLTADSPVWFTVERDWSHADDEIRSTARLMQASLRNA